MTFQHSNEDIMEEFHSFKHKHSEIDLMSNFDSEYSFYSKRALFVIFCEYYPETDTEINPIHYDLNYEGSEIFNDWLSKHDLDFEWYNECVGQVYRCKKKTSPAVIETKDELVDDSVWEDIDDNGIVIASKT
jgi:hypothetical protein